MKNDLMRSIGERSLHYIYIYKIRNEISITLVIVGYRLWGHTSSRIEPWKRSLCLSQWTDYNGHWTLTVSQRWERRAVANGLLPLPVRCKLNKHSRLYIYIYIHTRVLPTNLEMYTRGILPENPQIHEQNNPPHKSL